MKVVGIVATGTASHTKVRHEIIPATSGETLTVAFWAKVDAEQGQSREVKLSIQSPIDLWPGFYSENIVLDSTDWKEYTHTFDIEKDGVEEVWVGLSVAQSDIDFWIDDFRIFGGQLSDEIKQVETPVAPANKLPVSWGAIKYR